MEGRDDLLGGFARAGELLPVGAEGVGTQNLSARLHIGPVDVQQPVRVLQGGQLGGLPHGQPLGLEHGPHAAVQNDGAGRVAAIHEIPQCPPDFRY